MIKRIFLVLCLVTVTLLSVAQYNISKVLPVTSASPTISLAEYYTSYRITGTTTLSSSWAVSASGTPYAGMRLLFEYLATTTLSGNHISILGTQMPDAYAAKKVIIEAVYSDAAWRVRFSPSFDETNLIQTSHITDANVTLDKIEALSSANIIVGNSSNRPTATAVTGDIAISNTGVTSIGSGVIINADISGTADIDASKVKATTGARVIQSNSGTARLEEAATTSTEIGYLSGVTPGTAAANKAVVLTTGKVIDEIDITSPKVNGVAITASGGDINKIAGLTNGISAANKALVLGASKEVDDLTATTFGSTTATITTLDVTTPKIGGTAITSNSNDINLLAGAYAAGLTASDIQAIKDFATVLTSSSSGITINSGKYLKTEGATYRTSAIVPAASSPYDVTVSDDIIEVNLNAGDVELNLPQLSGCSGMTLTIIVKYNTGTNDIIFDGYLTEEVSYQGAEGVTATVTSPSAGALIICHNDGVHWTVGE